MLATGARREVEQSQIRIAGRRRGAVTWRSIRKERVRATLHALLVGFFALIVTPPAAALNSQTITFATLAGKTYGNVPFTITATASSGLAVSFTSLTTSICTVSANTVTLVAAGTCTIRAAQSGNGVFAAAPSVNQSFAVAKAAQTITFAGLAGRTYGAAAFAVGATSSSGLDVGFTSSTVAVCTMAGINVTIIAAGTCTIQATQAGSANFLAASSVSQSFAVAKANQTVTFAALAARTFGAAAFTVSATASSGLAVTFTSATTTTCTLSGATVTMVAAGTCTVQAAQGGNGNYTAATSIKQSFTIAKAAQSISFAALPNKSVADPSFTVSATATSALAVAFSSTTPSACVVSGTKVSIVATGRCTVRASQAGNGNYLAATNVDQTFSITSGTQTITFAAIANHALDNSPFTVAPTATSGLPVAITSLTPAICAAGNGVVSLAAPGTCTVRASQPGNATWSAAADVDQSFNVTPGNQSITFSPIPNQHVGTAPFYFSATASSGLPVHFRSLAPGVCPISSDVASFTEPGVCVVAADQPGDGHYAAAATATQSFVVVSTPQFAGATTIPVGTFPTLVANGDFNGDGRPDLAVGNAWSADVTILLGRGDGTLAAAATVPVGGDPTAIVVGDFNGDGKADLAVADADNKVIHIFAGNGTGGFISVATIGTGTIPFDLAIADFDGDGKPDLAFISGAVPGPGHTISVMPGTGTGTFGAARVYPVGSQPYKLIAADFNRDGKPDLAVADLSDNTVSILLGRGDGTFADPVVYATTTYPDAIAAGDFNGDSNRDIAVASDDQEISIHLGDGHGTLSSATNLAAGNSAAAIAVADLNGDGWLDLAVVTRFDNTLALFLGNGDGTFQPPLLSTVGDRPEAVIATDLNGDGRPDLIVTSATNNTISVLLQTGPRAGPAPATLSIQSGSSQSASIGTTYATPFAVILRDDHGVPAAGVVVTFSAPTAGASGSFAGGGTIVQATSNASGIATASGFTANTIAGPYSVSAVAGPIGATFALNNSAATTQSPIFTSGALPNGAVNTAYSATVTATGMPAPMFAVASGALPTGLTLNGASGAISGTPTSTGTFVGSITASNGIAPTANQSFSITIAQVSQTITFGTLSNQVVGAAPFGVSATATSGLVVSFSSLTNGVCTVAGSIVTIVAAGSCTIRASQAGNAAFPAAPNVDRNFAVSPATQTIAFGSLTDLPWNYLPTPLVATASSGLPVSFASLAPSVCAVSGSIVTLIAPGSCVIRATQSGNASYGAAPAIDQTFGVNAAHQTIAFARIGDQKLGSAPIPLSASALSGLPLTFTSQTPGICSVSGSTVTPIGAGTCTLRASQAGNSYYSSSSVDQSFGVFGALLAVPAPVTAGPLVEYATYLGGYTSYSYSDLAFDVIVGPDGSAFIGGSVGSSNFPGLSSTSFANSGLDMTYVAKLSSVGGKLDFAAAIGGRAPDITGTGIWPYVGSLLPQALRFRGGGQVEAMARDSAGNIYVAAYGDSADFPARGGSYVRSGSRYIFKITPTGAVQVASAAIDPAVMTIRALAVDGVGAMYFTGVAGIGLATSPGAVLAAMPNPSAALVTTSAPYLIKLTPGGTTSFATYLSASGLRAGTPDVLAPQSLIDAATTGYALAVDGNGNSYVAGQATSDQFPVTAGSPDTADMQHRDAFVAKVDAAGTSLLFVARLGGTDAERATGIALSPDGGIVIGGKTATQPFVGTSNAFQRVATFPLGTPVVERETGFVAKLAADGKSWLFIAALGTDGGTLVDGGSLIDSINPRPIKVAVDGSGAIYASGTCSTGRALALIDYSYVSGGVAGDAIVPAPNGLAGVESGGACVAKIAGDGSRLFYLAALGGQSIATGLAVDSFGNAYVAGYAQFPPMVVVDSGQAAPMFDGTQSNAFLAKINDQAAPVLLSADRSPASAGQGVNLRAVIADSRFAGTVDFFDGAQLIGSAAVAAGVASQSATFSTGIHRLNAVFRGSGPFNGYASSEIILAVSQASTGP